jgi:protein transport protein SEC61 subunit gamma-like protein
MDQENNKDEETREESSTEESKQETQPTQTFVPKKKDIAGEAKPSKMTKLKRFGTECKRVLRVTRKPDKIEFKTIVKISGIGIIIIGVIGFLIHFIKELLF